MDNRKKYELTYTYGVMNILGLHFFKECNCYTIVVVVVVVRESNLYI